MKVRFIDFGKQYRKYKDEIDRSIFKCLNEGQLILRDDVEELEKNLAKFVGTKYAVALNSGTDALYLALWAKGIGKGDEVLVPAHTFVATAQVVNQLGATPVLYDLNGFLTINENTRAIIPAHIAGEFSPNFETTLELAKNRKLFVIEDACQALGATLDGKMAGSFGLAGAFSFYPAKILGGIGDGGALVTNDESTYNKVKELRNHCKGDTKNWGINSRLDNVNAAVLNVKLKYLPQVLERRKEIAERYLNELDGFVGLPHNTEGRVWQDFIVKTYKRDKLFDFLKEKGIETMKNEYPMPIKKMPHAEDYERLTLRIPNSDILEDEEVSYVIKQIQKFKK